MRGPVAFALLALLPLAGCGASGQLSSIPGTDDIGGAFTLETRVCRPQGGRVAPIAILNHGAPEVGGAREDMAPLPCDSPATRWFVEHGYVAVIPMRRGFGQSGDVWAESPGSCASPDYLQAAHEGARDIALAADFASGLPNTTQSGLVVLGWDSGGMAALSFAAAMRPDGRVIAMAAGEGARQDDAGHVCRPERLAEAAGRLGAVARVPTLWIYGTGDTVFSPELAGQMAAAFRAAGGRADLQLPEVSGEDAHDLFLSPEGPRAWGKLVELFLTS